MDKNINIDLPEDLHRRLKIVCAINGVSIKDFIINSMERRIKGSKSVSDNSSSNKKPAKGDSQ